MGLDHLRRVEDFFKSNSTKDFSPRQVRDELNINYKTMQEVLTYLLDKKTITETGGRYAFNKKNNTRGGTSGTNSNKKAKSKR